MADGDVLQIVGGHQAFAAGGAGAAQQVSLLGPFTFDKDSVLDIDGSWASLVALEEGTVVIRAWAVFDEAFIIAGPTAVYVGITLVNAAGSVSLPADLINYDNIVSGPQDPAAVQLVNAVFESEPWTPLSPAKPGGVATAKTGAILAAYTSNTPVTAGSCRVYALIATPA